MEQALFSMLMSAILSPEGLCVTLLVLFITKRIVPYWIHDEALERLKRYEEQTPVLLHEFRELSRLIKHQHDEET